jgi:lysyl-tRNA synthetase class 1
MTRPDARSQAQPPGAAAGSVDAHDWVSRTADEVIARTDRTSRGRVIVCASGISPSGPIHLGNLREMLVPHFVADEIRGRGRQCRHILSWDDYDRLRKVPAGVPAAFEEHVGRPLSSVPDPWGAYANWAERFKAPLREALAALGVEIVEISQTQMYTSGAYTDQIMTAIEERRRIDSILSRYRTKKPGGEAESPDGSDDESGGVGGEYFPYRAYCANCGRDTTGVTGYDPTGKLVSYTCSSCGHRGDVDVSADNHGKLVWKVDWPMRWAFEGVDFEPAGADHATPGSSFTVGTQLVSEIFGGAPPFYFGYSFVGIKGMAKMSSSSGGVPIPSDALEVLEAPILRWLYVRRRPNQSFTIDLGAEVVRLYDEWDRLGVRVSAGTAQPGDVLTHARSTSTSLGRLRQPETVVPFRMLSSVVDVTAGDDDQIARLLRTMGVLAGDLSAVEPRLLLARNWVNDYLPEEDRTHVRHEPDIETLRGLSGEDRESLDLLLRRLADDWTLDGLTRLVYGVPKLVHGLELDDSPDEATKDSQKRFFRLLYTLLISRERGPRLPTLLMALGQERTMRLLTIPGARSGRATQRRPLLDGD